MQRSRMRKIQGEFTKAFGSNPTPELVRETFAEVKNRTAARKLEGRILRKG